jgi:hypothetical protein
MNILYKGSWILFAEAFGIWAFGAYWFVKNREIEEVKKILKGKRMTDAAPIAKSKADIADAI